MLLSARSFGKSSKDPGQILSGSTPARKPTISDQTSKPARKPTRKPARKPTRKPTGRGRKMYPHRYKHGKILVPISPAQFEAALKHPCNAQLKYRAFLALLYYTGV